MHCAASALSRLVVLVAVLVGGRALGCPDCPLSELVRRSLSGEQFWSRLCLVLLPLAVMLAVVGGVYAWLGRRPRRVLRLVRDTTTTTGTG